MREQNRIHVQKQVVGVQHELTGEFQSVRIRPLACTDIETVRMLRNRFRDRFIDSRQISKESQEAWYLRYQGAPGDYMFVAEWKDQPGVILGAAAIYDIDTQRKTGEFGRLMVQQACAGRGAGFQITAAVCRIGFDQLGLSEITLKVLSDNPQARRVYEKTGFSSVERTHAPADGELIEMSLTKDMFCKIFTKQE